jgi:hypothetical protein
MERIRALVAATVLLYSAALADERQKPSDYVPDAATATAIARAVLVARFGPERVAAQEPLAATPLSSEYWLVGGVAKDKEGRPLAGGGFGVFVNKHTGCILRIVEHLK